MKKTWLLTYLVVIMMIVGCSSQNADSNNGVSTEDHWPQKQIRMIIPAGTGGVFDTSARIAQPYLEEALGVKIILENKPGGGTELGTTEAFHQEADGYTILVNSMPELNLTIAKGNPPYTKSDFVPIVIENIDVRALFVSADSEFNDLSDFVAKVKANPGDLSIGVFSGGTQDIFARWLISELDLDVNIVGYNSANDAAIAVIGGHIDATLSDDQGRYNLREDLKALAIADFESNERWPEAKPFHEQGVDMPVENFLARQQGFFIHSEFKEQYPERFAKLQEAFLSIPQNEKYKQQAEELGMTDILVWEKGDEYIESFDNLMTHIEEVLKIIDM